MIFRSSQVAFHSTYISMSAVEAFSMKKHLSLARWEKINSNYFVSLIHSRDLLNIWGDSEAAQLRIRYDATSTLTILSIVLHMWKKSGRNLWPEQSIRLNCSGGGTENATQCRISIGAIFLIFLHKWEMGKHQIVFTSLPTESRLKVNKFKCRAVENINMMQH